MRTRYLCRSIGALFLRPLTNERVLNNVADKLESIHSIASSKGGAVSVQASFVNPLAVKIVDALQLGDASKASDLLSNVSCESHEFHVDDFAFILDYCARNPHPVFVMETWKMLEERNIASHTCYLHIMRSLCYAGCLEEAFAMVKLIGDSLRASFTLPFYNYLLLACIKHEDENRTYQCLDLMDSQMVGKNEVTYIALLKLAVWKNNISAVREIWKEYGKNYDMNILSLRRFIAAFASLNDLQYACKTMQQMVALVLKGEPILVKIMKSNFNGRQLDAPISLENGIGLYDNSYLPSTTVNNVEMGSDRIYPQLCAMSSGAERLKSKTFGLSMLTEHERDTVMKILQASFIDVIQACSRSKNSVLSEQLILQMQKFGLEPSRRSLDPFLRAVLSERGCISCIEVLKFMQRRNIKPNCSTLVVLSIGCSRELQLDLAELLLSEASECTTVSPYNALLKTCIALDKPERALKILAEMKKRKIKPTIKTYELLLELFLNVNAPYEEGNMLSRADAAKRMKAIEMDMLDNGIHHDEHSLLQLLRGLAGEGMITEMMECLQLAEQQGSIQDKDLGILIYNSVLHALSEAEESHMAVELFKNMKMHDFSFDAATYTIMIDCCAHLRCLKSASALVSLMIRDGFLPQVVTYTALMKVLLDGNNFDSALNLLHQALSDGHQPDVLAFNTVLNRAFIKGRIDIIEFIIEQMRVQRVKPDPTTCHYVFNAYVEGEFFSTAFEALEVLSLRMISEDKTVLQETRAEFEEGFILAEDSEAELRMMKLLGRCKENFCFALLNLRWCAIMGSELTWEPDHSPWSMRLSSYTI